MLLNSHHIVYPFSSRFSWLVRTFHLLQTQPSLSVSGCSFCRHVRTSSISSLINLSTVTPRLFCPSALVILCVLPRWVLVTNCSIWQMYPCCQVGSGSSEAGGAGWGIGTSSSAKWGRHCSSSSAASTAREFNTPLLLGTLQGQPRVVYICITANQQDALNLAILLNSTQ